MAGGPAPRQLLLPFTEPAERFAAADFIAMESNAAALAWLRRPDDWPERRLAIWGRRGCGKTHLLHIWTEHAGAVLCKAASLSAETLPDLERGIALDDADAVGDEAALLHLLNACRDAGCPVLLAATDPPARWPVQLPDLASRLRAILAIGIGAPEDTLLQALLVRLLAERQIELPASLQDWLLLRLPRTAGAVRAAVRLVAHLAAENDGRVTRARLTAALLHAEEHDVPADMHASIGRTRV
ncbi:MAG: chromosomal replication initiator DnaA [Acetobacteraceae bacterium]